MANSVLNRANPNQELQNKVIIALRDVTKSYGSREVLRNVSFDILEGTCVCVWGPNGVGKSTLLRLLALLEKPQSGSISIAGFDSKEHPNEARSCIGMVGHQSMLYENLTAQENLMFFGQLYGLNRSDAQKRSAELLAHVGLTLRGADMVKTFSRGMLQRLSLARALMSNPDILLLDEPYSGLDEKSAEMLNELILDQRGQRTIVMVSHDNDIIQQFATHILTINPINNEVRLEENNGANNG